MPLLEIAARQFVPAAATGNTKCRGQLVVVHLTWLAEQARRIGELCTANHCRDVRRAKDAAERDLLSALRAGMAELGDLAEAKNVPGFFASAP